MAQKRTKKKLPTFFVGLKLPEDILDKLETISRPHLHGSWVPRENFHITMSYIGPLKGFNLKSVLHSLNLVKGQSFSLQLAGGDFFNRSGRITHLWVGLQQVSAGTGPGLVDLKRQVDQNLQKINVPLEKRKFTPHITLAKFRQVFDEQLERQIIEVKQELALWKSEEFQVKEFILYSSHQSKNYFSPNYYVEEASFSLDG